MVKHTVSSIFMLVSSELVALLASSLRHFSPFVMLAYHCVN